MRNTPQPATLPATVFGVVAHALHLAELHAGDVALNITTGEHKNALREFLTRHLLAWGQPATLPLNSLRYLFLRDSDDAAWRPFALRKGCCPAEADAAVDKARLEAHPLTTNSVVAHETGFGEAQAATLPLSEWHDRAMYLAGACAAALHPPHEPTMLAALPKTAAARGAIAALSAHLRTVPGADALGVSASPTGPIALRAEPCGLGAAHSVPDARLWLWKNFVGGRPEYWAFDNPFPVGMDNDDPQTIGEPCGYALVKPSRAGRTDVPTEEVLRRIVAAQPEGTRPEQTAVTQPETVADQPARDAARYRWLRDHSEPAICAFYLSVGKAFDGVKFARATVDEAIDAQIDALKATP